MRILMIDDDRLIREFFTSVLTKAGYEVITAANGHEGIHRFREAPTELVITDLMMPVKDGITTIRELRQDFPTVKIIAISAAAASTHLAAAKAAGAQYTLAKPVLPRTLRATVQAVLSQTATEHMCATGSLI